MAIVPVAQPPVIPPKSSIPVDEVKTSAKTPSPAASVPAPDPNDLGNGDFLIDSVILNIKHVVQIIHRTDQSQFFPYLAKCKCGSEGRSKEEQPVRNWAQAHIEFHKNEVVL